MVEIETDNLDEAAYLKSIQRLRLIAIERKTNTNLLNFVFGANDEEHAQAIKAAWANGQVMVPAKKYGRAVTDIKLSIKNFRNPDEYQG